MITNNQQNIFSKPVPVYGIDKGSKVAVCLELLTETIDGFTTKIGTGTGFFHKFEGKWYLITNWHVVTGRNPEDPSGTLPGYPSSPNKFRFFAANTLQPNRFVPSANIPLYEDQTPIWIEFEDCGRLKNRRIDLVAIPCNFDEKSTPLVTPISSFPHEGLEPLRMGRELIIIGHPFGLNELNPYPIWKRGYVASEPSIAIGGMPKFYIDSPGRPGMSGSPVFMISPGFDAPAELAKKLKAGGKEATEALLQLDLSTIPKTKNILEFVGVYSGSVGDPSLEKLQLGTVWHGALVDKLFETSQQGTNPFPPFF